MSIIDRVRRMRDRAMETKSPRDQMELGKQVRRSVFELKDKGLSNAAIAKELDISERVVRSTIARGPIPTKFVESQTIWFPGIYHGRQGVYAQKVADVSLVELTEMVQNRAEEDGEWVIANGFATGSEDKMRKMIEWVSNPRNIQQCVGRIVQESMEDERTVDFVCRDLANGSKWAVNRND